jgi:threonine dehydrogenase-like Zn-dependent dehydrogenase
LDSRTDRKLVRVLATTGAGNFTETEYECPSSIDNGIIVKNIMTGVCTSDIAMMKGEFGPLPLHMQGHEGLGQVINVGANVFADVKVGDYVATRGEPAYADNYPCKDGEFVVVPEASPKYIIEPVACGINVILGDIAELEGRSFASDNPKLLIIGSGFLAYIAYMTLKLHNTEYDIDIVGSSNVDVWSKENVQLKQSPGAGYEVVVVLKENTWLEANDIITNNGLVIDAVGRLITKKESDNLLWKAATTVRPSPRKELFIECMELAVEWIRDGKLNVDSFWTKGYNRNTEWRQAFADGANRPADYSRGYLKWD